MDNSLPVSACVSDTVRMKFAASYPHEGLPYGGSKRVSLVDHRQPKPQVRMRAAEKPVKRPPLGIAFNDIGRRIPRVKGLAHVYFAPRSGRHYVLPHVSTVKWVELIGVYTRDVNLLDVLDDMRETDFFGEEA